MTWRVAILAFTIMLAGATAPLIRDAVGGRAGYRVMGVAMALLILVGVVQRLPRHPRRAGRGGPSPAPAACATSCRIVADGARLPAAADDLRAPGAGHRLHAGRASTTSPRDVLGRKGAATILFVCFVGPALLLTPVWARVGERVGKKRGYVAASLVLAAGALLAVHRAARHRRRSSSPRWRWSASGTPAARSSRSRCCPTRPRSTPGAPAATGPASTPASGPPARPSAWPSDRACSRVVLALGGYRSSTDGDVAQPDSALTAIVARLLAAPRRPHPAQPVVAAPLLARRRARRHRSRLGDCDPPDVLARLRRAAGRRPAGPRRPHPGLRLRLRAGRGRRSSAARRWRPTPAPTASTRPPSPAC